MDREQESGGRQRSPRDIYVLAVVVPTLIIVVLIIVMSPQHFDEGLALLTAELATVPAIRGE